MSKQVYYGTLFFCAVACSATLFAHPVQASANSDVEAETVEVQAKINVPVMFSKETYVRSSDDVYSALETKVDKYATGTMIGSGLNGDAEIEINGKTYFADAGSFVYGEKDVTALENQKKAEEEEKKRQEEEKKKAEEEAARQEELKKQQEEQAAAAAAAQAEAAAAAQTTVAQPAVATTQQAAPVQTSYSGSVLTPSAGVNYGPSGKETYYNLDMSGVVSIMRSMGNTDEYWVRADGVKMLGNYVMVAANLSVHPRGSLVATSLGMGIVCDTGGFAASNANQLDIATAW